MREVKILITGGDGFIANHLCFLLSEYVKYEYKSYDIKNGFDIRDKFLLNEYFEAYRPDVVIHMAARAGVRKGEEYPEEFISTNINGTKNIIDACEKYGVKQLISFSSSSVLGGNKDASLYGFPIETKEGGKITKPLEEDDEYNPKSIYAMTKVMGEMMVKNSNLNWTIIRPFTVYGENGRNDMVIYKWINQIKVGENITKFGDGKSKRGYTYVEDLVDGVKRCILNEKAYHQIIHLGGSEVISLSDMINIFQEYHDNKEGTNIIIDSLPMPKADVFESWTDSDKAKELLNWEPKGKFKDNLTNILKKEL